MAHGSTSLTRSENQRGDDGTGATVQVQATDPATNPAAGNTADNHAASTQWVADQHESHSQDNN